MQKNLAVAAVALFTMYTAAAQSIASDSASAKEECAKYLAAKKEGKTVELKEGVKCEEKKAKPKPAHDHGKVHKNQ